MPKIIIQGIPFDKKSSFLKGSRFAPSLIRKAYHSDSSNYYSENGSLITPDTFADKGDFKIDDYFEIEKITAGNIIKQTPLITLGGDHSITFPIIKAFHGIYGKIDILHIDAHSDLYSELDNDPYSHACPFYHIMKNGLAENLFQVGIRTLNSIQRNHAAAFGVQVTEMKDFDSFKLPKFDNPLYISLDLDALDPAFAPGVSHHEPGGLSSRQLLNMIQEIDAKIIGADIVEYNPTRDINEMTAMVCGKLLKEIAAKMV